MDELLMFKAGTFLCKRCGGTHHYIKLSSRWRGDCCVRSFIEYVDETMRLKAERNLGEYERKTEFVRGVRYIPHPAEPGRAGIEVRDINGEGSKVGGGGEPLT